MNTSKMVIKAMFQAVPVSSHVVNNQQQQQHTQNTKKKEV